MVKIKKPHGKANGLKKAFQKCVWLDDQMLEKVVLLMRCYLEMVLQKYQVRQVKQEL